MGKMVQRIATARYFGPDGVLYEPGSPVMVDEDTVKEAAEADAKAAKTHGRKDTGLPVLATDEEIAKHLDVAKGQGARALRDSNRPAAQPAVPAIVPPAADEDDVDVEEGGAPRSGKASGKPAAKETAPAVNDALS